MGRQNFHIHLWLAAMLPTLRTLALDLARFNVVKHDSRKANQCKWVVVVGIQLTSILFQLLTLLTLYLTLSHSLTLRSLISFVQPKIEGKLN